MKSFIYNAIFLLASTVFADPRTVSMNFDDLKTNVFNEGNVPGAYNGLYFLSMGELRDITKQAYKIDISIQSKPIYIWGSSGNGIIAPSLRVLANSPAFKVKKMALRIFPGYEPDSENEPIKLIVKSYDAFTRGKLIGRREYLTPPDGNKLTVVEFNFDSYARRFEFDMQYKGRIIPIVHPPFVYDDLVVEFEE